MNAYDEYRIRQGNKAKHQSMQSWSAMGDIGIDPLSIADSIKEKMIGSKQAKAFNIAFPTAESMSPYVNVSMASTVRSIAGAEKNGRGVASHTLDKAAALPILTVQIMSMIYHDMYKVGVVITKTIDGVKTYKAFDMQRIEMIKAKEFVSVQDTKIPTVYNVQYPQQENQVAIHGADDEADDARYLQQFRNAQDRVSKAYQKIENKIQGYKIDLQPSMAAAIWNKRKGIKSEYHDGSVKGTPKGYVIADMPEGLTVHLVTTLANQVKQELIARNIIEEKESKRGKSVYNVITFKKEFLKTKLGQAAANSKHVLAGGVFHNELPPVIDEEFALGFNVDYKSKITVTSNTEDRGDTTVIVKALNHLQTTKLVVCEHYAAIQDEVEAAFEAEKLARSIK